ncbi:MAG: outer membrane protein assembly factor BamE [Bdellovibrionales bacterium]
MPFLKNNNKFFILIAGLSILSACSPVVAKRGNMLEDYQIAEIMPGQSKRSDVLRTLGSPTTKSTFDSNVWYYIGQETEKRGIFDPKVVNEKIFLVAFDPEGTLEAIEKVDRERINIPYVRDKTKTHGNERTIVQEFLGNLGKFNPQQGSAATTGSGGL